MLTLDNGNSSFMPGVYINEATVIGATDLCGKPTYAELPESIRDLAIEVEFDIGKDWTKKVILKGNLKYDPKSPKIIADWGSAFVIRDFFQKTGCFDRLTKEELKEKLQNFSGKEIPSDFLLKIRGKKVLLVDYVKGMTEDGKLRYGTWNIVDTDEEKLKNAFKASVSRGYPSNYKPELLKQDDSFDYGSAVNEEQPATVDDDFIF